MHFPLQNDAMTAFESLREELLSVCLKCIDENEPFAVECDASDFAIAAVLSQGERPVAFMSRTLSKNECNYPTVEKEAASIIEAARKWGHYLYSRPFTYNGPVFIFDQRNRGKIKNAKIQAWRAELGMFSNEVKHRSGKENVAADALSRVCSVAGHPSNPLQCEMDFHTEAKFQTK